MDRRIVRARHPLVARPVVPGSKSLHQRALALGALAEVPVEIDVSGRSPGEDVARLEQAVSALGHWMGRALGEGRERLVLDLGLGATGFRFATALATLRPAGARTLVTGRPGLLRRPHRALRRALVRLGGHVRRRPSGAFRVRAGGMRGRTLVLRGDVSSQYASALLLLGPRIGGLEIVLTERPVSRPYLELTLQVLQSFGIDARAEGLAAPGGRLFVPAGAPECVRFTVEPDASSAAPWWAAAALTGGEVVVPGLGRGTRQADAVLLEILPRMGARVVTRPDGSVSVQGPGGRLLAAGDVDLHDAPDLLPVLGALAAGAAGATRLVGVAHARHKESDRRHTTAAAIRALNGSATVLEDGLAVQGGPLSGGVVEASGDHRLVLAFAALGLVVEGVVIRGAQAVAKSYPTFLEELDRATQGPPPPAAGEDAPRPAPPRPGSSRPSRG